MSISISVIIPVYNVEKYLPRCIVSVINQTYQPFEIILVDDGSTDSSGIICDYFSQKNELIKVIHKKNGGLSSARNAGLDVCQGEFVSFIDSDDWIERNMYQEFITKASEDDSDIIIGRRNRVDQYGAVKLESCRKFPHENCFDNIKGLAYLMSFCGYDMSVCDKIFKKKVIGDFRFPLGKTCEDSYTTYKFFCKAHKISYIDKPYYNYFYRENSISRNDVVNETVIEATKEQRTFVLNIYPELKNQADTNYAFSILSVCNEYIKRNIVWDDLLYYKTEMKKMIRSVFKNQYIAITKKIQITIFIYYYPLYLSVITRASFRM